MIYFLIVIEPLIAVITTLPFSNPNVADSAVLVAIGLPFIVMDSSTTSVAVALSPFGAIVI